MIKFKNCILYIFVVKKRRFYLECMVVFNGVLYYFKLILKYIFGYSIFRSKIYIFFILYKLDRILCLKLFLILKILCNEIKICFYNLVLILIKICLDYVLIFILLYVVY